jgi:hypothetical protein
MAFLQKYGCHMYPDLSETRVPDGLLMAKKQSDYPADLLADGVVNAPQTPVEVKNTPFAAKQRRTGRERVCWAIEF